MRRLSTTHGAYVFWDEAAEVPDGGRRSGERFADLALNPRLDVSGPPGHGIEYEYPVTHLLPPDLYVPYIDAAGELMAETVDAVA